MEEFFRNIAKFFGGLVGDEETNAGIAIHAPTEPERSTGAFGTGQEYDYYTNRVPLPFSFIDGNNEYRSGVMFIPTWAQDDINHKLEENKNSEAIQFYGMELDDGTTLDYEQGKDLLNSLTPDKFRVHIDSVRDDNRGRTPAVGEGKAAYSNETFMNNLRSAMRRNRDWYNQPYISDGTIRSTMKGWVLPGATYTSLNNPNSKWKMPNSGVEY